MAARRRIRLIAVGGTIACLPDTSGDGVTARLTAEELAESVPGLAGPVGELVEGDLHVWYHPAYEDFAGRPASVEGVVVELVRMSHDASPTALRAVATSEAPGLVFEGTGGSHVPPRLLDALDAVLATGMPIVLATRCPGVGPLTRTYVMPGGEIDLIGRGLIPAGNLSGQKARLRLLVGLAAGREPVELFPVG